jgi:hypothetical protein
MENNELEYRSGRDCVHGHKNPLRLVPGSNCLECYTRNANKIKKPKKIVTKKKIEVYIEPRITIEEQKVETFKEMAQRIYDRKQTW